MGDDWPREDEHDRNRICRLLFAEIVTNNKRAVRIIPRPEFRAFSSGPSALEYPISGSDGD